MAWFKVDDRFHTHPKVVQAGNAAIGLWTRLGAWCSDHLTDGHVPSTVALMFGTDEELDALVDAGLLRRTGTGLQFADWLDYNPSAEQVRDSRQRRSNAGATAGKQSANQRATKRQRSINDEGNDTPTISERSANENRTPHPHPHPHHNTTRADAVDNSTARTQQIISAYVAHLIDQAGARGTKISNMDAYRKALEQAATNHPDLATLSAMFPTAPPTVIAAAMHGDKHSLAYYPRADELPDTSSDATIIELRATKGNS